MLRQFNINLSQTAPYLFTSTINFSTLVSSVQVATPSLADRATKEVSDPSILPAKAVASSYVKGCTVLLARCMKLAHQLLSLRRHTLKATSIRGPSSAFSSTEAAEAAVHAVRI
jgi:hypothetical protein